MLLKILISIGAMLTKHLKKLRLIKGYSATRYTFGIWDFVNKTGESLGYYATLSVPIVPIPVQEYPCGSNVYSRIVKSDGSEIFSQAFSANVIGGTQFQPLTKC